jgi:hypothetical protein
MDILIVGDESPLWWRNIVTHTTPKSQEKILKTFFKKFPKTY